MTEPTLDVVAIGNAIVDVIAQADDDFVTSEGVAKGSMRLMDEATSDSLYSRMGPGREISGGSAANTVAGMAALGAKCGFIGQVADDQLGAVFAHDIRANHVVFDTAVRAGQPSTARCLILVTPDAQRTMNTFLGASQFLPEAAIDHELIASARILYLEGYLWDPEEPRAAMRAAIEIARAAGRKVAFTLSDTFCISRHRADFLNLIDSGLLDILFANESELLSLVEGTDFDAALEAIAAKVPTLVVTRGVDGAVAVHDGERATVPAEPVERVVDTTGAGDLFAAGFLAGQVQGRALADSLRMGAIAAAEVISHYGARPEAKLSQLVADKLG
ncbi:adenosine kinase [uncultured Sphingomonas sp.]|uniref:adenosine kinase n=1 Tax=uncultured Sphingomonas sp. TaxID=158754 RepID=UPI0025FF78DF|nr:adenosine kinase [uncultured Sphingomonas sp.]